MSICIINEKGELLEIIIENEILFSTGIKVNFEGYYEVLNEQMYSKAIWDFKEKCWVGVGEKRQQIISQPSELDKLKADIDYLMLINGGE